MAFFSKSLRNWTKKHDFIEGLTEWSPTEYVELTKFTSEYSPTDFRCNFRGCTCLRSALPLAKARSAPTKQAMHWPSKWMPSALLVQLRQLHPLEVSCGFGGCLQGGALVSSAPTKQAMHQPSKQCTKQASCAPTKQMNAICFVGAAETAAPPGG